MTPKDGALIVLIGEKKGSGGMNKACEKCRAALACITGHAEYMFRCDTCKYVVVKLFNQSTIRIRKEFPECRLRQYSTGRLECSHCYSLRQWQKEHNEVVEGATHITTWKCNEP